MAIGDNPALKKTSKDLWVLLETFSYYDKGSNVTIAIDKGFIFDLASVPRFLWNVLAPWELSIKAPLVHDFLYWHGGVSNPHQPTTAFKYSRRQVDDLFYQIMLEEKVSKVRAKLAWCAVRVFGKWDGKKIEERLQSESMGFPSGG